MICNAASAEIAGKERAWRSTWARLARIGVWLARDCADRHQYGSGADAIVGFELPVDVPISIRTPG
jgi:hypothetical protein